MKWLSSEGGPLILVARARLLRWRGVDCSASDVLDPTTDYGRACGVRDFVGLIDVGDVNGLVFGDEPMQTTWLPADDGRGGLFVRWHWSLDETSVLDSIRSISNCSFVSAAFTFTVNDAAHFLFDSALAGARVTDANALLIELAPGRYGIQTAEYRPNPETSLVLHKLSPVLSCP